VADVLERIVVVGTSCCGKTAFSRSLAELLGFTRIGLGSSFAGLPRRRAT